MLSYHQPDVAAGSNRLRSAIATARRIPPVPATVTQRRLASRFFTSRLRATVAPRKNSRVLRGPCGAMTTRLSGRTLPGFGLLRLGPSIPLSFRLEVVEARRTVSQTPVVNAQEPVVAITRPHGLVYVVLPLPAADSERWAAVPLPENRRFQPRLEEVPFGRTAQSGAPCA